MDITVEAIEALRVPDGFTPVVGFRRFGIPWPPRGPEHYLVQKGHRWMPQMPTVAECRRQALPPTFLPTLRPTRAAGAACTPGWT